MRARIIAAALTAAAIRFAHFNPLQAHDLSAERTRLDLLVVVVDDDLELAHVHGQVLDLVERVAELLQVALHCVRRRVEYVDVQVAVYVCWYVHVECAQYVLDAREETGAMYAWYLRFACVYLQVMIFEMGIFYC